MGRKRSWTTHEIKILRSGYDDPALQISDVAEVLGRSRDSVVSQAKRMGLQKAIYEVPPP